jgi:ferredoxin-type protein NapG
VTNRDEKVMDRRAFFGKAIRKTTRELVNHVDSKLESDALRWIRPPYALAELEFLLSCTRCGDCIEACPHTVLFPLSARLGARVGTTPAMDLINKGCHLCEDWPCVSACEAGALSMPETDEGSERPQLPVLARVSINTQTCFPYSGPECGACEASCPVPDALLWDQQRPHINEDKCVGCGLCREACIVDPSAISIASIPVKVAAAPSGSETPRTPNSDG